MIWRATVDIVVEETKRSEKVRKRCRKEGRKEFQNVTYVENSVGYVIPLHA